MSGSASASHPSRPASHTPGPWVAAAGPSSIVGWPVVSRSGRSICRLTWLETNSPAEEVFKEETRANGHLIAAAPDLLEALKMARRELAAKCGLPIEECVGSFFEQINAAINLAEQSK